MITLNKRCADIEFRGEITIFEEDSEITLSKIEMYNNTVIGDIVIYKEQIDAVIEMLQEAKLIIK